MSALPPAEDQKRLTVFTEHIDESNEKRDRSDENDSTGKIFSIDDVNLPPAYFRSVYFWGSMFAIGMSLMCGVAGFSFIAPLLPVINADIGPSPYLTWVALTYTLTGAVGLMIVG